MVNGRCIFVAPEKIGYGLKVVSAQDRLRLPQFLAEQCVDDILVMFFDNQKEVKRIDRDFVFSNAHVLLNNRPDNWWHNICGGLKGRNIILFFTHSTEILLTHFNNQFIQEAERQRRHRIFS